MRPMLVLLWLAILCAPGFSWSAVEVLHRPDDEGTARMVRLETDRILSRIFTEFGLAAPERITVILASSQEAFAAAHSPGRRLPSWVAGTADPDRNRIVLKTRRPAPGLDVRKVLYHELAHLVLARAFRYRPVPTWLNEGLTMHLADDWHMGRKITMSRAVLLNRVIPIRDMVHGFPASRVDAETAYAESYYILAFLRERCGPEVIGRLIRHLGLGVRPDRALSQAGALEMDELDEAFSEWLGRRFFWPWLLAGSAVWWGLGAMLLVAAFFLRRRAAKRTIAQWEEADGSEDHPGRA